MISVLVPGIRPENWKRLYDSVERAYSNHFQIVFCGPKPPPLSLLGKQEVSFIKDYGSPIRCQQIALLNSDFPFITWAADDGWFMENSLNIAYDNLIKEKEDALIMGKYIEGSNDGEMTMQDDSYYVLSNHQATRFVKQGYFMLNVGLVPKQLLMNLGGWNCDFEVCPMAYNDFAVRAQDYGIKFIVQKEIMFQCTHLPGYAGDHGPIHDAQILHDEPLFRSIYRGMNVPRKIRIDLLNYKKSPEIWTRRFRKDENAITRIS